MSTNKKLIQLTRQDFQKAMQQAELIKQWAAEIAVSGEAPVCMISVNSEGKKFVRMIQGVELKKVSAILKQISDQLKFIQPVSTKPN